MSEESDDESIENNNPPKGVDITFAKDLIFLKHKLYRQIIYLPDEKTDDAQSVKLVFKYNSIIQKIYGLFNDIKKGLNTKNNSDHINKSLKGVSKNNKKRVIKILDWIDNFYHNNDISMIIPYTSFIESHLHFHPFSQSMEIII